MIRIADDGDVTIQVGEERVMGSSTDGQNSSINGNKTFIIIEEFLVSRAKLAGASAVFKAMLFEKDFQGPPGDYSALGIDRRLREVPKTLVQVTEPHPKSIEIWFRAIHQSSLAQTLDVDVSIMWYVAHDGRFYNFDINILKGWFGDWYSRQNVDSIKMASKMLYPCYAFDHAQGFTFITKMLVYGSSAHISQLNPTSKKDHQVPVRIMAAMNAAKGSIKKRLSEKLFFANERLLQATCNQKENLTFRYLEELVKTGVYPLDHFYSQHSIDITLKGLGKFKFPPTGHSCGQCPTDFERLVKTAITSIEEHFDGLCLDCIDRADKTNEDPKANAERDQREGDWSRGCRVTHDQPSWYFSVIARKDERDHFLKSGESNREKSG